MPEHREGVQDLICTIEEKPVDLLGPAIAFMSVRLRNDVRLILSTISHLAQIMTRLKEASLTSTHHPGKTTPATALLSAPPLPSESGVENPFSNGKVYLWQSKL